MLTYGDLEAAAQAMIEKMEEGTTFADQLREERKISRVDYRGRRVTADLMPGDRYSVTVSCVETGHEYQAPVHPLPRAPTVPRLACPTCDRPNPAETATGLQCWWCGHAWDAPVGGRLSTVLWGADPRNRASSSYEVHYYDSLDLRTTLIWYDSGSKVCASADRPTGCAGDQLEYAVLRKVPLGTIFLDSADNPLGFKRSLALYPVGP